jgi:hypothetical protein
MDRSSYLKLTGPGTALVAAIDRRLASAFSAPANRTAMQSPIETAGTGAAGDFYIGAGDQFDDDRRRIHVP